MILDWNKVRYIHVYKDGDPLDFSKPMVVRVTLYADADHNQYDSTSYNQFWLDSRKKGGWSGVHEVDDTQMSDTDNFTTFPASLSAEHKKREVEYVLMYKLSDNLDL